MTSQEFTNLFQTQNEYVYNYCYKLVLNKEDAEDIMHDVFLNLWHHKPNIDTTTALNYLTTSARNKCYDLGRRKLLTQKILAKYVQEDTVYPNLNKLDNGHLFKEIHLQIELLFPIQKQLVKMRYIDGYELSEIYKLLGKNRNTVRNQIFAGIANIRKKLKTGGIPLPTNLYKKQ